MTSTIRTLNNMDPQELQLNVVTLHYIGHLILEPDDI
jgi:hypothetical protein